jgi:VRR-NUC domain.
MLGGRTPTARAALMNKYKSEGFRNGVADILYLQPRGGYAFLAIEMKTPDRANTKNGGATEDQLDWLKAARSAGAMAEICHGAEAAWDVFQQYMSLEVAGAD